MLVVSPLSFGKTPIFSWNILKVIGGTKRNSYG